MARIAFCAVTVLLLVVPFSVIADEGHRQIYLLMGQSNMVGRGPPHPRVLSFNEAGKWIPAVDPLHETSSRDRVGPGVSFGRGMLHVVDQGVTIGLVPCAVGGSPLSRWEKGGDLYAATVRRAREAAKHGVLKGILWMQGEKDAKDLALAKSYAKRLDAMILDFRREFGMPELPFVAALPCAELAEKDDRPGAELVSDSLRELPRRVRHTTTVDSAGLKSTGDQTHFSTPSQRELGRRYAEAMATLLGYDDVEIPDCSCPYRTPEAWRQAVPAKYQRRPEYAFVEADPELPNVLLIGDSISMSYTVGVRETLAGIANVYRAPDNCRSTRQTLEQIETYLGHQRWDVIHFNWGIHDLTHLNESGKAAPPPEGKPQIPLDQYRDNIQQLLRRLRQTGARLIWASTTPVGRKAEVHGFRRNSDVIAYNHAAKELLKEQNVGINDLYSLVKPQAERLLSDGVHFTRHGQTLLAGAVAQTIQNSLADENSTESTALSPFARKLLAADDADLKRLSLGASQKLIELAPVNLPTNPKGDNDHFGWPVATMVNDTLIVVHRAMPGHNRKLSGDGDADTTYSTIVRSTDGGQSWSEPYDVRRCMTKEDRNRGGSVPLSHRYKFDPDNHSPLGYKLHLNAIGTTRDGAVILISDHGAFRSEDKGRTWKHLREAFREDRHDGPFVSVGPRLIDHPEHGLLLFAHHTIYKNHRPHDIVRELAIYRSRERGESWEKTRLALPDWCKPAEPDVIFHDNHFVAMVRNQAPANILAQMRFQFGDAEITDVANTNMKTRRSVDTSAICFNPVTKRYEVVQSKREDMSINLFSIAPEDWKTAKWRLEGQLFKRTGSFYSTADGFHTGGAVIDEKRGVQHVFFYSGHPGGPAGVFRLTRTLDTPKLAEFLKPRNRPDERDTVHWTGNAKTTNWKESGNWDPGVPDQHDVVIFDGRATGQSIQVDDVVRIGRLELQLANKTDRLTLAGSGTLTLHGAEYIRNKHSTALIQTGILDIGPQLNVEIRNQRFVAGNQDGTIVVRSDRVRAGEKEPTSNSYKSDGENLKLSITDRGAIQLMTEHWEPGMSLDMSASHTEGPKVFDFALKGVQQGVTFIRLKEHDGDPVEVRGFEDDDFLRFRANPLKSCDKGKEFQIDAVKFVGWPNNGKAAIKQHGKYWYLKPATASLPETLP
ncbi:MAG: sialate O-acetylesterase [Planctomycetota bacterium]